MMLTFWSHDAKVMPKQTYQHHDTERPKKLKPKQLWSLMMPTSESHDAKMKPKKITKIRHHERPKMPKQLW